MTSIKILCVSALLLVSLQGWSQSEMKNELCIILLDSFGMGGNYSNVDSMPHFPGGDEMLDKFILENLKIPVDFISWNSKVITEFVVDTNGQLIEKKILKGLNADLDREVLAVLNNMPPWVPGKCKGRLVPVLVVLPVNIALP